MRWWSVVACAPVLLCVGCTFDLDDVQALPAPGVDASAGSDGGSDAPAEGSGLPDGGDGVTWPESSVGNCATESDCPPSQFCNDVGKCEACVGTWSATGGGDHCGDDWNPANGEPIAGEHLHVGAFEIADSFTVPVKPREGVAFGELVVRARTIRVGGTLSAAGAGHAGGEPGGGGPSSEAGGVGTAGGGDYGGSVGGSGTGSGSACDGGDREPHASGGTGAAGTAGGYAAAAGSGDTCQAPRILLGSAGGGGGGGGGGQRSTCCSLSVPGGEGGRGGRGGRGGGPISLFASHTIDLSGHILTTGSPGEEGQPGAEGDSQSKDDPGTGCDYCSSCADHRYAYCPGMGPCGSAQNDCCQRTCCFIYVGGTGGAGGRGGHGAGGGVLLEAPSVTVSGFIDALGGSGDASNGGTVSIVYKGVPPSTSGIAGGLVCTSAL